MRVDLLVHYKELKRTTNTGRLIIELLEKSKIWIRGQKDAPLDHSKVLLEDHTPLLLYPSDEAIELSPGFMNEMSFEKPIQLIVPDGNWRQASKVHYRVEDFKHIQRVKLPESFADRENLVRKESKIDGMSTLESIAHALGLIESPEAGSHVLKAYRVKKNATLKARGEK